MLFILLGAASFLPDTSRRDWFDVEARLCASIEGYRKFQPHTNGLLRAGGIAHIYVEPSGYRLTTEEGESVLHLRYDWKLYDSEGTEIPVPAWLNCDPADRFDRKACSERPAHFFQQFRLPLPKSLKAARYRIDIRVTNGDRTRTRSVEFEIP